MVIQKSNVSARVESTLKRIVKESDYTHKDTYELGAKLIAKGDAEKTIKRKINILSEYYLHLIYRIN